eukprot:TRINITY_DN62373_c0_g1_i1.p1 TRINITY_DN62373_c0_g1~~TRINITY_DN62373_c0_g1_i1.p1  ORF type:complete len:271 (+),score=32.08 TRINITY_DN62373_c0_g1_i1:86-814(+)
MACALSGAMQRRIVLATLVLPSAAVVKPVLNSAERALEPAAQQDAGPLEYALNLAQDAGRVADHASSAQNAPQRLMPGTLAFVGFCTVIFAAFVFWWCRTSKFSPAERATAAMMARGRDGQTKTGRSPPAGWDSVPPKGRIPGGEAQTASVPWRGARHAMEDPPEVRGPNVDNKHPVAATEVTDSHVHFLSAPTFGTPPAVLASKLDQGGGELAKSCQPKLSQLQGNNARLLQTGVATLRGA